MRNSVDSQNLKTLKQLKSESIQVSDLSSCVLSNQSYREFYTPKERLHNGNSSMLYSVVRKDNDKEFCMKCIPYVQKMF